VKDRSGPPGLASIALTGEHTLVVPVVSGAGGVGRSTVSAILAVALHQRTADFDGRVVAVCDTRPRAASPWPGWVDQAADGGTGWLAARATDARLALGEVTHCTSAIDSPDGGQIWVLTDTGAPQPGFSGAGPEPGFWAPALPYLRAAVIDSDSLEGFRLGRQRVGGEPGVAAAWLGTSGTRCAVIWVTDPSPDGMSGTLAAITAAEECGLPARQFIVVVNDHSGHGWTARSRSRRTMLTGRVGAIIEISLDTALRRDSRPRHTLRDLSSRDISSMVAAVISVAGRAAPRPAVKTPEVPRPVVPRPVVPRPVVPRPVVPRPVVDVPLPALPAAASWGPRPYPLLSEVPRSNDLRRAE
jgi:hypothetical protein